MKTKVLFAVLLGAASFSHAQDGSVGIGTTKPDNSAILDLSASNKGMLIPRMSLAQRDLIQNPAVGLKIYQTDGTPGEYSFTGTKWVKVLTTADANSVAASGVDWATTGNTGITASDFIGTVGGGGNIINFKVDGIMAGQINKDGSTFFGHKAGNVNTTTNSTAFGTYSLQNNTSGNNNTAMGYASSANNTTGYNNVSIGTYSQLQNTTGYNNLSIGGSSLASNTSGFENVALGSSSLNQNQTGFGNVAIGSSALRFNLGSSNVGIGSGSLYSNSTGVENIALGYQSLYNNTTGNNNSAFGNRAGYSQTIGTNNVFIGFNAGYNETGSNKLYISSNNSVNPLIKGDFAENTLKINSKTTGFLAVGDWDASIPMPTPTGYRMIVQDGILTEKVKVALRNSATDWADYVFEPSYKNKMMTLEEVEKYTLKNKHLPNVPSAEEMVSQGLDVAKSSKMFMEKIEELTLYIIELNKKIKELETKK